MDRGDYRFSGRSRAWKKLMGARIERRLDASRTPMIKYGKMAGRGFIMCRGRGSDRDSVYIRPR